MPIPKDTSFESLAAAIEAGTLTAKEMQQLQVSTVTAIERQALLIYAASLTASSSPIPGGTWGASPTLPTVNAVVVDNFTNETAEIPASRWYSIQVVSGADLTWGANTLLFDSVHIVPTLPDGQAYLPVSIAVPSGTLIQVSYLPS